MKNADAPRTTRRTRAAVAVIGVLSLGLSFAVVSAAADGKPAPGTVGKVDQNMWPGPHTSDGTDGNNGYRCDGNNGAGQGNPALGLCTTSSGGVETGGTAGGETGGEVVDPEQDCLDAGGEWLYNECFIDGEQAS
jgi:hypothetical protein